MITFPHQSAAPTRFAHGRASLLPPPRFHLGQTVVTPNALRALSQEELITALARHVSGDWGEVDPGARAANERALEDCGPLLSADHSRSAGTVFYVVTDWDRSLTVVLLPTDRTGRPFAANQRCRGSQSGSSGGSSSTSRLTRCPPAGR